MPENRESPSISFFGGPSFSLAFPQPLTTDRLIRVNPGKRLMRVAFPYQAVLCFHLRLQEELETDGGAVVD